MFGTVGLPPSFTDEQRVAIDHDAGHLLIVAGAGTGKTTTLAARLAALLARGAAPERVLLLTFSRRAAAELLGRAEQMAGHDRVRRCWGGTYHAVANRLLRQHGSALGLDPSFTVLDQADAADLLALVRAELLAHDGAGTATATGTDRRRSRKDTAAAILSRVVNTATPLSKVLEQDFPWCQTDREELRATFGAYTARKRRTAVLDYDDLLLSWDALLRSPAGGVLAAQFDHILVDEYQDTNSLQANILEGMAAGGATITAVGDDAQAIYSFRAATPRNILEFPERFGAQVTLLTRNHRSTPQVLASANAVMDGAAQRHVKQLRSERPEGPRPALVQCHDEAAQSAAVCSRILEELQRGTPLVRQAVLFRTSHHSDLLELELNARRIPYVKYGGLRFLEAAHVKDLVSLLRVVENPRDELAWFRVLQLIEGVGPATARKHAPRGEELTAGALPAAGPLLEVVADARRHAAASAGSSSAASLAIERCRAWLDPVVAQRYPAPEARVQDLDQLAVAATGATSLARFLAELTVDPPSSTSDLAGPPHLDDDYLVLSTIHSAKGCEWDAVHVLQVTDGSLPSDMATGNAEAIEEERRLLHVAMTRAKTRLWCYAPLRFHVGLGRHRRDDRHTYAQPSRFLTAEVLSTMEVEGDRGQDPEAGVVHHAPLADVDALVHSLLD